jgi:hypothetical protein
MNETDEQVLGTLPYAVRQRGGDNPSNFAQASDEVGACVLAGALATRTGYSFEVVTGEDNQIVAWIGVDL